MAARSRVTAATPQTEAAGHAVGSALFENELGPERQSGQPRVSDIEFGKREEILSSPG